MSVDWNGRMICHLDCDAFFVSVEQVLDPSLVGKVVAVGGGVRGIIASASYEARARGVYTPMPVSTALRVCPDLILVSSGHGVYGKFSRQLFDLCAQVAPVVERASVDEGYLDCSALGWDGATFEREMRKLQARIKEEVGVGVSMGLATSKLVSAVASKLRKPRGFTVVRPGAEAAFLAPCKASCLPGVGPKTEERLAAYGVRTVADLIAQPPWRLEAVLGSSWEWMLERARGIDDSEVTDEVSDPKSVSSQETFPVDLRDPEEIERQFKLMVDGLCASLRKMGKKARTVTITLRLTHMEESQHGRTLGVASDLEGDFYDPVVELFHRHWNRRPLRLIGVRFSSFADETGCQPDLFGEGVDRERARKLSALVDKLNAGGATKLMRGHGLKPRPPGGAG